MNTHLERLLARVAGSVVSLTLLVASAQAQVPTVPTAPGKALEPAKTVQEAAGQAVKEARQAGREAAEQTRDTVQGARREAREAGREARQVGRELGREVRDDARDLATLRGADIGLWFSGRADADGLVIADVAAQGAIAKVGFQEGDRIVSVNGQRVTTEAEFMAFLRADDLRDQRVKVIVFRGGREQIVYIQPSLIYRETVVYDPLWRYGIVIDDRYPDRIVILRVYPRTPAYYAGLRAGDVVIGLRGQRIARVADFASALANPEGRVALRVNRGNRPRDLEIDADASVESRTTLRPNLDAETRIDGRGKIEGRENRPDLPADEKPRIGKPGETPLDKPAAEAPKVEKPSVPEKPRTPNVPDLPTVPAPRPSAPATTPPAAPPATGPATPPVTPPATPLVPSLPRLP